ncbi:MAG: TrmH family RNA methyltransferase [Gemmataceae bacterium]
MPGTELNREPSLKDYLLEGRSTRGATFIVEGRWPVEQLLAADFQVRSVLCVEGQHEDLLPLVAGRARLVLASKDEVNELLGFHFHRGVLACAERPTSASVSESVTGGFVVVCPEIADESNLGAIVRNAAAFGAAGVVVPENKGADVYSRKSIRASSGSVFRIKIFESHDLMADVRELRGKGFPIIGTSASPDATSIRDVPNFANFAVLLGSERAGLSHEWLGECDMVVTVPMSGRVDSLNVACGSAVVFYALTVQSV